jgi:hypothetical protein
MTMHPPWQSEGDEAVMETRKAEAGEGIEGGRQGGGFIRKVRICK